MFFVSKKKQRRDQGAGLVFRWRRARRHHAGKVLAMLLTLGFFGFAAYAIQVEGLRNPLQTKRTSVVVMLTDDDPNCQWLLLQVEERAPFPLRWDPASDPETMGRVKAATSLLEGRVWDYRPSMAQLPENEERLTLPSIVESGSRLFLDTVDTSNRALDEDDSSPGRLRGDLRVRAQVVADPEIRGRLPSGEFPLPRDLIADEWFGHSFRFLLGIDALGVVRGCLPLSGGSLEVVKPTEQQKFLAAWLRRTTFKASDHDESGVKIGVLELHIEARDE